MARIFRIAEHLAGLMLKAEKCRVVPLCAALSACLVSDFRQLLRECSCLRPGATISPSSACWEEFEIASE
eukprot:2131177-Pyramimonas_sp.AAC.1